MAIIVSEDGNNAQKLDESDFEQEGKLQEYVKNNPDIIPIYEISEEARLLILAREFGTNSGRIDALGVDQDGNIYVIETKLYKNPDKRIVLAQALDYGASLWRHSGDGGGFVELLKHKVKSQFNVELEEKLQDFFELDDSQFLIDTMAKNVVNGNIKFVILMDKVDDRLKELVTYVNRNSRFDIYAVELKYYKHEQFEIIIPKLYGSEVKKEVAGSDSSSRFDNQKILEWIEELKLTYINVDNDNSTRSFVRFTTDTIDDLIPPRETTDSGWKNGNAYYYEIQTNRTGYIRVGLEINSTNVNPVQKKGQEKLLRALNKQVKKSDWVWFAASTWKVNYQADEQIIKEDIIRILTKEIPEFEKKLGFIN